MNIFVLLKRTFDTEEKVVLSNGIIKKAGKVLSDELNDQVSELVQLLRHEAKVVI